MFYFKIKIWFQNRRTKWKREYFSEWELWSHRVALAGNYSHAQAYLMHTKHILNYPLASVAPAHPSVAGLHPTHPTHLSLFHRPVPGVSVFGTQNRVFGSL